MYNAICLIGDTVASGSFNLGLSTCEVWSISEKKRICSVKHDDIIFHVQLVSDPKLGFDLITCSEDTTVKLWREGQLVKTLEHSNYCYHSDLGKQNRLLAIATRHGVTLWRVDDYSKMKEVKIGETTDVRFNTSSTKLVAMARYGSVYEISLQ